MNKKEIGEIRRRMRRERSNMTAIYGCYVNENQEVISEFRRSTGIMPENEAEKYFGLFRRVLSGSIGRNLIDITFKTSQVANSPEHKFLMELRGSRLEDAELRKQLYQKVMQTVNLQSNYLILLGCETYDVPFKSKDDELQQENASESYSYILCGICPVKQTKSNLHYVPENKEFHDGGIMNIVSAPELGFLFPAFDNRSTNIYNALYYTHSPKESYEGFVEEVFHAPIPKPAARQKESFEALLSTALEEECSMEVVQTVHERLCQTIEMHKESKVPEPLLINKEQITQVLSECGVDEAKAAKFGIDYDEAFGFEAEVHPQNLIDSRHFTVKTPDVSIQVAPDRADLVETRIIGGVKYILIPAEDSVEVNGVLINISDAEPVSV